MTKSKEDIFKLSRDLGYKPEIIEKVDKLLNTLKQIVSVPYLRERLVLKGGTALNLFAFDGVPRLSVDIDLNYIGELDRTKMFEERKTIDAALEQIFLQNSFDLYSNPGHHAGGKMVWRYSSVLGQGGNIEIDLNYMYRRPLWPCIDLKPNLDFEEAFTVPVLDIHELAAGKLSALFTRQAGRDLFDAHYLFTKCDLDLKKLRLSFVIYLAMTMLDVSKLSSEILEYNIFDVKNKLLPVLRQQELPKKKNELQIWADKLLSDLKMGLRRILPLSGKELEFIEHIRTDGMVHPKLITDDDRLREVIAIHPAIKWAAMRKSR